MSESPAGDGGQKISGKRGRLKGRPVVIWTLQRTGGTNLTQHLTRRGGHVKTQHEPFNRHREFGHVTHRWEAERNREKLLTDVERVCSERRCIKHCVEQVPWAVTEALAAVTAKESYVHLFLYRQDPLGRLLSVEYAKRTGAWGPGSVRELNSDAFAFFDPLDIAALVQHERRCVSLLQSVWSLLVDCGRRPAALAYEDVYAEDDELALASVRGALLRMGLSDGLASDRKFVNKIRGSGHYGTRSKYERFQGIEALKHELESAPRFSPDITLRMRLRRRLLPRWVRESLWRAPRRLRR